MSINTQEALARHYADYGDITCGWVPTDAVGTDAWTPYDMRWVATTDSDPVTVTNSTEVDAGSGIRVMKSTASASGTGSHREWMLRSDKNYVQSEIRSVIFGHGTWADSDNMTQQGHVHRAQRHGSDRMRAFVAWHDAFVGLPSLINVGLWNARFNADDLKLHSKNAALTLSPVKRHPVTYSNRAGNVVTAHVPSEHGLDVNSHIDIVLPTGDLGATNVAVTGVNGSVITYTDNGADGAGGGGYVQKHSSTNPYGPLSTFPFIMASRLLGNNMLQAKIWRLGDAEPAWSAGVSYVAGELTGQEALTPFDPESVPSGPGVSGLLVAHLNDSEAVRYGNPQMRELSL